MNVRPTQTCLTPRFFDLSRFGIQFVATPHHADGIHVTGQITKDIHAATIKFFEALPTSKVVIASAACAISGIPFYGGEDIVGNLTSITPVDMYIPGLPFTSNGIVSSNSD
jgi:Ni,Fe-hydrogenase III small subunit